MRGMFSHNYVNFLLFFVLLTLISDNEPSAIYRDGGYQYFRHKRSFFAFWFQTTFLKRFCFLNKFFASKLNE